MKSRYDPREDRMLLVLTPEGGERKLWVTRRQWLAVYRQVAAIAPAGDDVPDEPRPPRTGPIPAEDVTDAEVLQGVQIKRSEESTTIVFNGARGPVTLTLRAPGLARLKRMLEVQADRAGWDAAAGLERLGAEALAANALRQAKT